MNAGRHGFPARFVVAAAIAGLALRLAFALVYWVDKPLTRDEVEYLSLARSLAAGHGYVYDAAVRSGAVEPFGRAPGYPVFLALTGGGRAVTRGVPVSVQVVQSIAGAVGVFLVGVLAWRLGGGRAARIAAGLAAIYPPLVWLPAYALSEAVFFPVGLAVAWLFDWALERAGQHGTWGQYRVSIGGVVLAGVVVGVAAGLAVLVRAATTPFLGLAALWLLWRQRPVLLAGLVLGAALVLVPWSVRCTLHYGRFVLVATDGGVTFWTGNNPLARGEGDMAANPELKHASLALRAQHPSLDEEQMEPIYYREALAWIRSHPLDWIRLEFRKLFYLVVPIGPSYRVHSPRYFWASVLSYGAILPVAAVGLLVLGARRGRAQGLWLLAASSVAVCLLFFPQERFRMPVLDSALVICAGCAWANGRGTESGA